MFNRMKPIALAAVAVSPIALAAASTTAAASPVLNFSIVTNQFSKPTMEFEYQNGKYVWKQQTINTQFAASANTNDNNLLWVGMLEIETLGVGGSASFTGSVPSGVKSWSLKGPIVFPVKFLSVYQAGFANYCEQNGVVGKPVVNHNLSILYSVNLGYYPKPTNEEPVEIPQDAQPEQGGPRATRNVNMPMAVSCGPKPSREITRPGGVKQETPDFKVKGIALNYGGAPATKKNPTTECKSAKLSVILHTTKAGVVDIKLHKKVGAGPIQAKNMQLYSKFDGNAHFVASHIEYVKVSQPTLVQAMAEEFNSPVGQTTGWKDVTLHCYNVNGGYAGTPGTSTNPDDANFPRHPKRVFDGAKNLAPTVGSANPDNRNARQPFKPVIAPATPIKTAPVPQRDTRFIGTMIKRTQ